MHNQDKVDLWEQSLTMLQDNIYLDIIRNFLGKIPTPFHKPQLTKRLTNLFLNPEFRNRVLQFLSEQDKQLLATTVMLETPTQDEVCTILSDRIPYASLMDNLINLEERLLLVPHPLSPSGRFEIMVNPLLLEDLIASSLSYSTIFTSIDTDNQSSGYHLNGADSGIIRALISLHIHESLGSLDRSERLLRNKYAASVFGSDEPKFLSILLQYNRLLFHEMVIEPKGKLFTINVERASELIRLSGKQLQRRLFVSAWMSHFPQQGKEQVTRAVVRRFYQTLTNLLDTLAISKTDDLLIVCKIAASREGLPVQYAHDSLALLQNMGLIAENTQKQEEEPDFQTQLVPTIDSDLTISFSDHILQTKKDDLLHILAVARKVDTVSSYEINKSTIMQAFDYGLSVDEIITYLTQLTHTDFSQLEKLITHWRDEFSSIIIYDGIVIKADQRQSRIIEALPQLQPHIIAKIAPSVFLLSRKTESTWRDILISTGLGFLPQSISEKEPESPIVIHATTVLPDESSSFTVTMAKTLPRENKQVESTVAELRKAILTKAGNPSEREEMLARLERRLILIPQQIAAVQGPSHTMQASGFDYQGKVNLCKAAISSSSDLLELHVLDDQGESHLMLTEAKEFINTAPEPSIRVLVLPQGEERVLSLKTLFKVRKLKRSVFFQM